MKLVMAACAAIALAGCMSIDPMGGALNAAMADSNAQMQAQGASMMAAQASAQAAANRPGDTALSCDALQAELTTIFQDPAFQAAMASAGASAQAQMDKAKSAQAGAVGFGLAGTAAGVAGSMIPGMGWLAGAAMQAQMASAAAQIPEANRARAQMMGDVTTMLPAMYRGQRIHELATAKKCPFINETKPT